MPRSNPQPAAGVSFAPLDVLIVDDQELVRTGLRLALERDGGAQVVGEVPDGDSATAWLRSGRADVVIVAITAPGSAGLAAVRALRARHRNLPVLVVSSRRSPGDVRDAFEAGALGFLPTSARVGEVIDGLRAVTSGASYLHPAIGASLARPGETKPIDELSSRERQVLRLIALGHTNPEIARELVVSVRTVETHRSHLSQKLRAGSRAEMVRAALDAGLLSEELIAGR